MPPAARIRSPRAHTLAFGRNVRSPSLLGDLLPQKFTGYDPSPVSDTHDPYNVVCSDVLVKAGVRRHDANADVLPKARARRAASGKIRQTLKNSLKIGIVTRSNSCPGLRAKIGDDARHVGVSRRRDNNMRH